MQATQPAPILAHFNNQNDALNENTRHLYDSLEYFKLISYFARLLQSHRGSTLGWLSGQPAFLPKIESLQHTINRLFFLFESRSQRNSPVTQEELIDLRREWQAIVLGWQQDYLEHNFEFHTHLVDKLLRLLRTRLKNDLQDACQSTDTQSALQLSCELIPEFLEDIAQLRGLSTCLAVDESSDYAHRERIAFLIRRSTDHFKVMRKWLEHQTQVVGLPRGFQSKYNLLVRELETTLLESFPVTIDSAVVFSHSSEVVDQLWQAVNQNLAVVEQQILESILTADT